MSPRRLLALAPCLLAGCVVHAYHPMQSMGGPVIVDPRAPNFQDLNLTVTCVEGDGLDRQEANKLCDRVGTLFETQGANVRTVGPRGAFGDGTDERSADQEGNTDLSIVLSTRLVHESTYRLSWLACIGTLTLVPGVAENTFAQDVVIRDGDGFLLLQDSLQGRIVRRFGFGAWVGNALMDALVRKDEDKLTNNRAAEDLSRDLYEQLSQMVFNAKMRSEVLRPEVVAPSPGAAPSPEALPGVEATDEAG